MRYVSRRNTFSRFQVPKPHNAHMLAFAFPVGLKKGSSVFSDKMLISNNIRDIQLFVVYSLIWSAVVKVSDYFLTGDISTKILKNKRQIVALATGKKIPKMSA